MERLTTDALPSELREENYNYPPELFRDHDEVMVLRFDGSEAIDLAVPVTISERPVLMARYAVAKALHLTCGEDRLVKVARLEYDHVHSFRHAVKKAGFSRRLGKLEDCDVEIEAEALGVYEIVFPFDDPEKMEEEARHVEQQFSSVS